MFLLSILSMCFIFSCAERTGNTSHTENVKSIDVFENDKKAFTFNYNRNDRPKEVILVNSDISEIESKSIYNYQDGKFIYISTNGSKDLDFTQQALNDYAGHEALLSKGINFNYPEIVSSEISDVCKVLAVGKDYNDFTKDSIINGNFFTIKFTRFNKKIRFYPSIMTQFIDEKDIIKDYSLTVKDSLLDEEVFILQSGNKVTRTYFYENRNVKSIKYSNSGLEYKLVREFEYQNW